MVAPILNAAKFLPASLTIKALEKFSPKFKNYFARVAAYGLDTNRALDWVTDRFRNEQGANFEGELESGAQRGTLRPDEMVARQQINQSKIPGKVVRSLASLGGGFLGAQAGQEEEQQAMPKEAMGTLPSQKKEKAFPLTEQLKIQHEKEYPAPQLGEDFFKKGYKALKSGKTSIDNRPEPFLNKAKPYYENGTIDSPEDLKDYYQFLQSNQGQSGQQGQGSQGNVKEELMQMTQEGFNFLKNLRQ